MSRPHGTLLLSRGLRDNRDRTIHTALAVMWTHVVWVLGPVVARVMITGILQEIQIHFTNWTGIFDQYGLMQPIPVLVCLPFGGAVRQTGAG